MPAPPPTVSRLSTISTQTLSSCLDLTRLHQLEMAAPAHLSTTIQRNLSQLARGIASLEDAGETSHEVLVGLRGQFERIVGLVEPLGVVVEERLREPEAAGKTGRLVETDDEARPFGDDDSDDGLPAKPAKAAPHVAIPVHDDRRDLAQMEEDEEEMERANNEVLQMQKRMMDDQDTQLDSLSSAISRQHALSLRVAEELELHSSLIDDTDEALDRTESNLRRASGRLDQFTQRARETGSTGLIVALIILLVILILIFKV
ncbi:syntaxin [Rhodotorula paludigena]|uniref:syntaxin n=1 Tax=Rhodotorula paludigena TaxID=86838 RepID=UPI00317B6A40